MRNSAIQSFVKFKVLGGALVLALTGTGCMKGDPGPAGPPGAGKIVSTMNCGGTITGSIPDLNGLDVEYDAVLTAGGDVYATANIIDVDQQVSGTAFYAAGQAGASNAEVLITADEAGPATNGGYWKISLDRSTLVTKAVYTDNDYVNPITMTFLPSACTVQHW